MNGASSAFAQLFDVLSSAWLAKWANSYSNPAAAVSSVFSSDSWTFKPWSSEGEKGPDYYMKIYLALSIGYIIILACRSATFRISSVFAARRVYDRLSASVYVQSFALLPTLLIFAAVSVLALKCVSLIPLLLVRSSIA